MSTPNKTADLARTLRERLHGDIKDIHPGFLPDRWSSDAQTRFDQYVQESLTKRGEQETEKILAKFHNKIRDLEREVEMRIWETIFGPERTFKDKAYQWGEREEKVYARAQRVREVYKREKEAKEEAEKKGKRKGKSEKKVVHWQER
ncbi:MAG: hypothetical protein ASARMPRED_000615 [Alectoria sarmentosa]|nr:MAG: hypothetical protein ASARMPRED_000615 [Alectoria sarmentosa]